MNQVLPRTYTPSQVAEIYQVSESTVYQMIKEGKLLAKRINERQYRIAESELSWVTSGIDQDLQDLEERDLAILDNNTREILQQVRRELQQ